jgi:hypothetical protein
VKKIIDERTTLIETVIYYLNIVLSFSILIVVFQSYRYLKQYMQNDKHDNKYINSPFVAVDNARKSKGLFVNKLK